MTITMERRPGIVQVAYGRLSREQAAKVGGGYAFSISQPVAIGDILEDPYSGQLSTVVAFGSDYAGAIRPARFHSVGLSEAELHAEREQERARAASRKAEAAVLVKAHEHRITFRELPQYSNSQNVYLEVEPQCGCQVNDQNCEVFAASLARQFGWAVRSVNGLGSGCGMKVGRRSLRESSAPGRLPHGGPPTGAERERIRVLMAQEESKRWHEHNEAEYARLSAMFKAGEVPGHTKTNGQLCRNSMIFRGAVCTIHGASDAERAEYRAWLDKRPLAQFSEQQLNGGARIIRDALERTKAKRESELLDQIRAEA